MDTDWSNSGFLGLNFFESKIIPKSELELLLIIGFEISFSELAF